MKVSISEYYHPCKECTHKIGHAMGGGMLQCPYFYQKNICVFWKKYNKHLSRETQMMSPLNPGTLDLANATLFGIPLKDF